MKLTDFRNITDDLGTTQRMPALFIGHGSPMNGLADNDFTRSLGKMAMDLPSVPRAVLVVSAHWLTQGTHVLTAPMPRTIHDFGGFPEALYAIEYPAPGAPELAEETRQMITHANVINDDQWGLDHGTWTVLRHMFPEANVPVYQLSINYGKSPIYHYNLAQDLKMLRDKGVLIIGSGNIVHNLYQIDFNEQATPFVWAREFDALIKTALEERNIAQLVNYSTFGSSATLSVPTNDHYLPMMYTLGLMDKDESLTFTYEGIQHASISMRSFRVGE